ncbi:NADPH:quinone oxidoreductase family protein [Novosphingobium colocasiae]|nr:NADPH:quinone oxidoreductase family protein [Novosphingobium colocasiae]
MELAIAELPVPQPGAGEVRLRVCAAGFGFGETLVLKGRYQKTPDLPYVPCSEMSGWIDACGEGVADFAVGERVAAFDVSLRGGGLAQYCVLPARFVHRLPAHVDLVDAAGFLMNHWTAFNALVRRGMLQQGEVLVVHGATGGTAAAAIDVARAIGARIIAVGGDDERLAGLRADHVINHRRSSVRDEILALTDGRGADVFFDPVGGDAFDASMRAIAPGGRILVVGFASGQPAVARTNVVLVKMISIIGVEARLALERTGDVGWADFQEMLRWLEAGRIGPSPTLRITFDEAVAGLQSLLERRHTGKCVVVVA